MKDIITQRQDEFNNLISIKFSPDDLKNKFSNIQQTLTLIGENDNYARLLKSFEGIEADDMSILNAQELRADFMKQLLGQLAEFGIYLQPLSVETTTERTRLLPVSQAA